MPDLGNLREYQDPALYDAENRGFEPEGPFYLALIERFWGPVLELGCGTGRLTIPIAEHGVDITGVDILPAMLERARAKAGLLPITWVWDDVRTLALERRFALVFESGATFQHMLTRQDQLAMLVRMRDHLSPGGRVVVTTLFPHPELLSSDEVERDWYGYTDELGREVWVTGMLHYDPLRQVKTEVINRHWRDPDGHEVKQSSRLQLRYTFPQEMLGLLQCAGLAVVERYGDWDASPLDTEARYLIYVCERAVGA